MNRDLTLQDIVKCCTEIFPQDVAVTYDFVRYVQPEGLKNAYRQRIKENHPDKARVTGISEDILAERFRNITAAYQCVLPYIEGTEQIILPLPPRRNKPSPSAQTSNKSTSQKQDHESNRWQGRIPQMRLRFGEYLYYSGRISWKELRLALAWQRKNRPLIGALAVEWRFISSAQLTQVITRLKPGESFCQGAVRLGILTPFQRLALLGRQAGYGKKIGEYFMIQDTFFARQLTMLLREQQQHNFSLR